VRKFQEKIEGLGLGPEQVYNADENSLHIHYPLVAVNSQGQKNWKMMV
jgi:hypothetical protein